MQYIWKSVRYNFSLNWQHSDCIDWFVDRHRFQDAQTFFFKFQSINMTWLRKQSISFKSTHFLVFALKQKIQFNWCIFLPIYFVCNHLLPYDLFIWISIFKISFPYSMHWKVKFFGYLAPFHIYDYLIFLLKIILIVLWLWNTSICQTSLAFHHRFSVTLKEIELDSSSE